MATSRRMSTSSYLLVAAFDFGTTYSGYAFSFRDAPDNIQSNQNWNASSQKLISRKTPTCVLVKPNKEFEAFGYDAENKYADLCEDGKHHDWYLFRRFKMALYNNKTLTRHTHIEDISGKSMPAMTIFSMAIGYLRNHMLKSINSQRIGIEETDILYVLTVPAIWEDNAKQFMREAAIEGGMDSNRLKIALEPEAASIWCQTQTTEQQMELSGRNPVYGDRFRRRSSIHRIQSLQQVLQCKGGTADISVHEKRADGRLKELHKASGGPWGGNSVDINYINFLTELFGKPVIDSFKEDQMTDYFDMLREFETTKRSITTECERKVIFRVAVTLKDIYEKGGQTIKRCIASSDYANWLELVSDKMKIQPDVVRSWFVTHITKLLCHVKDILAEPHMQKVRTIVLVGGFGECQLIHDRFRRQLTNKRLLIPADAGLAVLKGAVRFGHMPKMMSARVMKMTYGMAVQDTFIPKIHPESNMMIVNGKKMCVGIFRKFVSVGDEIDVGYEVKKSNFTPSNMQSSTVFLFASDSPNPTVVRDASCKEIGDLTINHSDGETLEAKKCDVTFIFGETELRVKVKIQKTGRELYTAIDCLNPPA